MKTCSGEFGFCEFCCCCWFSCLVILFHGTPATPGVSEAFDKLEVDTVDSDRLWRNQQQQQNSQKPNSPPQLFIPSESANTSLQIPSFGPSLAPPGMGGGGLGLAAPSINLLPATPVSGGASGNHVPFQQVLRNLNEQRQQQSQGENGINSMSSHGESYFRRSLFRWDPGSVRRDRR